MEYEFLHDTLTGNATARFSLEHQVIGPWLELEVGQNTEQLAKVLSAIDEVESGRAHEQVVAGKEYSLLLNKQDAEITANGLLTGAHDIPEALTSDNLQLDELASSSCGVDDFRDLLLSWAKFVNKGD
jgi:uncharacterized protein YacL (UPF0231 family)